MRRVTKAELVADKWIKPDGLSFCLDLWVRLMHRNDSAIGWRGRSAFLETDASADSQQLYDRADCKTAEAVKACIDSMPRHLGWAIEKSCGINRVWHFPQLDYMHTLMDAKEQLTVRLRQNHETRTYFD